MGFGDDVVGDYPFLLLLFSPWYEARYLNVRTILRSMMVLDCSGGMLPKEPGRSCVFASYRDVGGQLSNTSTLARLHESCRFGRVSSGLTHTATTEENTCLLSMDKGKPG